MTTRTQALRTRRKAAGLIRLELWVPKDQAAYVKDQVATLVAGKQDCDRTSDVS